MSYVTCTVIVALSILLGMSGAAAAAEGGRYPQLAAVKARLKAGERVKVAYLGGSITWGATSTDPLKTSYRALVTRYLEETYPQAHVQAIDAAIGGQPSELGVFRMDRDVLPYAPDLVFVEFSVNDGSLAVSQETIEGIFRKLHKSNPNLAIVHLIIGAGKTYGCPKHDEHVALAEYYGVPYVDIFSAVAAKLGPQLTTADILSDGCHPNDAGYRLYADIICRRLEECADEAGTAKAFPEKPLTANRYESAAMLELSTLPDLGGWKPAHPAVVGTWFDHQPSRWMSSAVAPKEAGAVLPLTLECAGVGLYFETTRGGGKIDLQADGATALELPTDMPKLDYSRVNYKFKLLGDRQKRELKLVAEAADHTQAAYLLYTR